MAERFADDGAADVVIRAERAELQRDRLLAAVKEHRGQIEAVAFPHPHTRLLAISTTNKALYGVAEQVEKEIGK